VRGVQVDLGAEAHRVPADVLAPAHRDHRHVPEDLAVDRMHQVGLDEILVLEVREGRCAKRCRFSTRTEAATRR
jgi:hypothetical protein